MADNDSRNEGARFAASVPARPQPYTLKGSASLDWGSQPWASQARPPWVSRARARRRPASQA